MKTQTNPLEQRAWRPNCWIAAKGTVCNEYHVQNVMPLNIVKASILTTAMIEQIVNTRHPLNEMPWMYGFWVTDDGQLVEAHSPGSVASLQMRCAVSLTLRAIEKMMRK